MEQDPQLTKYELSENPDEYKTIEGIKKHPIFYRLMKFSPRKAQFFLEFITTKDRMAAVKKVYGEFRDDKKADLRAYRLLYLDGSIRQLYEAYSSRPIEKCPVLTKSEFAELISARLRSRQATSHEFLILARVLLTLNPWRGRHKGKKAKSTPVVREPDEDGIEDDGSDVFALARKLEKKS